MSWRLTLHSDLATFRPAIILIRQSWFRQWRPVPCLACIGTYMPVLFPKFSLLFPENRSRLNLPLAAMSNASNHHHHQQQQFISGAEPYSRHSIKKTEVIKPATHYPSWRVMCRGLKSDMGRVSVTSEWVSEWVEFNAPPDPTQYRSFRRRSSQPMTWVILTNKGVHEIDIQKLNTNTIQEHKHKKLNTNQTK